MEPALPLVFDASGLLPVVVQDHLTGEVRMVAFANADALRATLASGRATFFSRSRSELWEKGKTSGHGLSVRRVLVDCDADCLIYAVDPAGPSCHTGAPTCFFRQLTDEGALAEGPVSPQTLLERLETELEARKTSSGAKSYTKSLYDGGPPAIGAKIEEEAGELARAIAGETDDRVESEAADLIYHLLVGLRFRGVGVRGVLRRLHERMGTSGLVEKANRTATSR